MRWDERFDLVSVGGGAGGLSAAITAAAAGARALVVEKSSYVGGVTARSLGQAWVGANHLAVAAGMPDDVEDTRSYLDFLAGSLRDGDRQQAFIDGATETVRYLCQDRGLDLEVIPDWPDYYYPIAPGSKAEGRYLEAVPFDLRELGAWQDRVVISPHGYGYLSTQDFARTGRDYQAVQDVIRHNRDAHIVVGGSGLCARLVKIAVDLGVEIRTECAGRQLVTEDATVTGIEVSTFTGGRRIAASAVVLATGGYDWNPDFVRSFEHLDQLTSLAQTTVEGDHLTMGTRVGAMLATTPAAANPIMAGFPVPGFELDGHPAYFWHYSGPHSVLVNRAGDRFADESFYPAPVAAYAQLDGATQSHPHWPAWLVFDESYREKYPVGPVLPGTDLPDGTAVVAPTVSELAKHTAIDEQGLLATIDRLNDACASGVDRAFGRGTVPWSNRANGDRRMGGNPNLGRIATAPFYAIKLHRVGGGMPAAGLTIDTVGRVLDSGNRPIAGLYAAGNSAARLETVGYQSGLGNTRGLTFGHLAALDVIDRTQRRPAKGV
jgi:3-oxosteroid 1-dehydrogenase